MWITVFRALVTLAAVAVTVAVLKDKTDALSVVSLCYYASLATNIIAAFASFNRNKILAIALVLFLLCDTVVGLQVAINAYLPIAASSLLYRLVFMPFNLSWFFYLPSQTLAAVSSTKK